MVTFNDVTKDAAFYTTTSRFVAGLGLFPRKVSGCGCQRTFFGTYPHGHRLRFYYFVTSTSNSLLSATARRSVRRLSHRLMFELVLDCAPRMMSLSSRGLLPSHSRSLTASLRLPLCGMRALPPLLTLLPSPHSIRSPNRSSATGSPSLTSNLCSRARVALNS
jgi:hypothetical protein